MVSLEDDLQHFWVFQGFPPGSRNQDSRRCLCSRHLQRPRPRCEQPWLLRGAPRALEGPWDKPLLSSQKRAGIQQIIADPFPTNQAFSGGMWGSTKSWNTHTLSKNHSPLLQTEAHQMPVPGGGALSGHTSAANVWDMPKRNEAFNGKIHLEMWDVRLPYLITRWCMYINNCIFYG